MVLLAGCQWLEIPWLALLASGPGEEPRRNQQVDPWITAFLVEVDQSEGDGDTTHRIRDYLPYCRA